MQSPCPAVTESGRWCRNAPNVHVTHGTITRSFWYDLLDAMTSHDNDLLEITAIHADFCTIANLLSIFFADDYFLGKAIRSSIDCLQYWRIRLSAYLRKTYFQHLLRA